MKRFLFAAALLAVLTPMSAAAQDVGLQVFAPGRMGALSDLSVGPTIGLDRHTFGFHVRPANADAGSTVGYAFALDDDWSVGGGFSIGAECEEGEDEVAEDCDDGPRPGVSLGYRGTSIWVDQQDDELKYAFGLAIPLF